MAVLALSAVIFGLGRLAIISAGRADAEKKRGDALQQSVNSLRGRADEEKNFLELIRELLTAQGDDQKKALVDQLRGFQFSAVPNYATPTTKPGAKSGTKSTTPTTVTTPATTTTPKASPTTATPPPRAPPPTTAPPFSPPKTCVTTPVATVCSP